MNDARIKELLERFYRGITTEAEERELRNLLAHSSADEFETDKAISEGLIQTIEVPSELEQRLNAAVDSWDADEHDNRHKVHLSNRSMWMRISGVAASIAILVGTGLVALRPTYSGRHEPSDTYSDPAQAYAVAQQALTIFADALNKGMEQVEFVEEISDQTITTAIDEINKINSNTNPDL